MDNLNLERIPWEAKRFSVVGQPLTTETGESPVIEHQGRHMVSVMHNGVRVPFYRSTGAGGKKETTVGSWYPAMGVGEEGWINKTHGADLANYYNSDALRKIGEHLDEHVGDPTQANWVGNIPKVSAGVGRQAAFLNEMFKHRPLNGPEATPEQLGQLQENISNVVNSLDKK